MSKLKCVIVLASGVADEPIPDLADRTPLDATYTPALDELARDGKIGGLRSLPEDLPASEEVALLSVLGYDPHEYFCGEAGLAAADAGVKVGADRLAFAHNLATEADGVLRDHAAGHISLREAEALLKSLSGALGRPDITFHVGRGFAGVTVIPAESDASPVCMPPEQALGSPIRKCLPRGKGSELPRKLVELSREVLREHDINRVRADLGENPANVIWPWGPGRSAELPSFESAHGLRAAMVAAPGPARGLGRLSGMHVPEIAGATGCGRTDYTAKAQSALELIQKSDLVVIHIASAAEASLEGNIQAKVRAIEDTDAMITAPLLKYAREDGAVRILFVATHIASVLKRSRIRGIVPLAMYGPGVEPVRGSSFAESAAREAEIHVERGHELLQYFLRY